MNILIIGASGFIGGILHKAFSAGHNVVGTSHLHPAKGLIPFSIGTSRIFHCLDAEFAVNLNVAILAAMPPNMDTCAGDSAVWITGMEQLCTDLLSVDAKIIFLSTNNVFSGRAGYYNEAHLTDAINAYGLQKEVMEQWLLQHSNTALIYRLDKVISGTSHPKNLLHEWATGAGPIRCIKDQIFAPTSAYDLVEAIERGIRMRLTGLFHVCNPEYFTRADMARLFLRQAHLNRPVEELPMEAFGFKTPRPLKTYLDSTKFRYATAMYFHSYSQTCTDYLLCHSKTNSETSSSTGTGTIPLASAAKC